MGTVGVDQSSIDQQTDIVPCDLMLIRRSATTCSPSCSLSTALSRWWVGRLCLADTRLKTRHSNPLLQAVSAALYTLGGHCKSGLEALRALSRTFS